MRSTATSSTPLCGRSPSSERGAMPARYAPHDVSGRSPRKVGPPTRGRRCRTMAVRPATKPEQPPSASGCAPSCPASRTSCPMEPSPPDTSMRAGVREPPPRRPRRWLDVGGAARSHCHLDPTRRCRVLDRQPQRPAPERRLTPIGRCRTGRQIRPRAASQSPKRSIHVSDGRPWVFMPKPCPPVAYMCSSAGSPAARHAS